MKKLMVLLVALSSFVVMVHAEDIVMSWSSNGVVRAEGIEPGSTCSIEWASTLDSTFTNATENIVFNNLIADDNGEIQLGVPMFFRVKATPPPDPTTEGMVTIPGGTNSGTDPDFGAYSLTVESFYMDSTEVSKEQWDEVYSWAITNGYAFDNVGAGKASTHPVQTVNWYDCVKWCNARSEKAGKTPCYTVSSIVYRTGESSPDCDFDANGYRLPTSDEWEYAARGGLSDKRFPWGDTVGNTDANYYSSDTFSYDTGPTRGYNSTYDDGVTPYTSPVGSFAPNGYGLYDMAGNVYEWCNTTPSSGSYRYVRGGGWYYYASNLRCGYESWDYPSYSNDSYGFRAVCR
jgi:formylglycine-generating enzyme required for sulfatase activity